MEDETLPPPTTSQRSNFLKRVARLVPGNRSGVHVLQVNGELITDEEEIDEALCLHWRTIFADPHLPPGRLDTADRWLEELGPEARLPIDDVFPEVVPAPSASSGETPHTDDVMGPNVGEFVRVWNKRMNEAYEIANRNIGKSGDYNKRKHDGKC